MAITKVVFMHFLKGVNSGRFLKEVNSGRFLKEVNSGRFLKRGKFVAFSKKFPKVIFEVVNRNQRSYYARLLTKNSNKCNLNVIGSSVIH